MNINESYEKKSCGWCKFWEPKLWVHQLRDNKYPIPIEKGKCSFESGNKNTCRNDYCENIVYLEKEQKKIPFSYVIDL